MAGVGDQLEIKFRLNDGSDIGPKTFPAATSIATLKESVLAQWPRGVWNFNFFLLVLAFGGGWFYLNSYAMLIL